MELGILPQRYSRNQTSLDTADQLRLHLARVSIVGLGGLGGAVTEILARTGVGKLTLIDGDSFDESNLNRQLLSSCSALGRPKAEVATQRVEEINPAVRVRKVKQFLRADNGTTLLAESAVAVDCLDTIHDRFVLEEACRELAIPLVSAAIGGTCGQATVIYPGDPGLQSIYGRKERSPKRGAEATLGTMAFAAVSMAAMECAEVIGLLLGRESQLRHSLLITDISDHSVDIIPLQPPND